MKVILFRHDETDWNILRRLRGQQDLSLSAGGRAQVVTAAGLVQWLNPDLVVAPSLARAAESARALGFPDFHVESRLAERCLGEWERRLARDVVATEGGPVSALA